MRRNLMLALALAAVLSLGVAAVASAVSTTLRAGDLIAKFGGTTSPKALSKTKYTPVTANLFGELSTSDGTHPPAFREAVVDIDKDVKVNVKGYPASSRPATPRPRKPSAATRSSAKAPRMRRSPSPNRSRSKSRAPCSSSTAAKRAARSRC